MFKVTATEAKTNFGKILRQIMREPVFIEKSGKEIAVILSIEEYQHLVTIEDMIWAQAAIEADKEGYIGVEESEKFLKRILKNAKA